MEPLYYSAGWLKNRALDWLTFRALPPLIQERCYSEEDIEDAQARLERVSRDIDVG